MSKQIIDNIRTKMESADINSLDFLTCNTHPSIQKDGIKYEILTIFAPEEGDESIELSVIPSYGFCLKHITVTKDWRSTTWAKLDRIVESEINRIYGEDE